MIRFTAHSNAGRLLGMGLSFGNLDELAADRPIVFELGPYQSQGRLVIACGDEQTVALMIAAFPDRHVIGLTPRTLVGLRSSGLLAADVEVEAAEPYEQHERNQVVALTSIAALVYDRM